MKTKYLIFVYLFLIFYHLQAQNIPIGAWRTHAAYLPAKQVVTTPERIYCATENGLFFIDRTENTIETLSKIDGLSENIITAMAYHAPTQTLVLAYDNANIDLLKGTTSLSIRNINTIRNAALTGSKRINHILFSQNIAYLSTDFGLIVLDVARQRLLDTYQNLGTGGTTLAILGATTSRDSLLLATEKGVRIAAFNANTNLKDFNNWKLAGNSNAAQNIEAVVNRNNVVYAYTSDNQIIKYQHQTNWQNVSIGSNPQLKSMSSVDNLIVLVNRRDILLLDASDNSFIISHSLIINPQNVAFENNNASGSLWVADNQNGLIKREGRNNFIQYVPNGVARQTVARLVANGQEIIATSGGASADGARLNNNAGFYIFDNAQWQNFNSYDNQNATKIPDVKDAFTAVYNPNDRSYYIGTLGDGLLIRKPDNTFERIAGNPLQTNANNEIRITGLALENRVGLWVANASVLANRPSLHLRRTDGTWQSYNFASTLERMPTNVFVARNGFKWLTLDAQAGGGILVFDEKTNRSRVLSTSFGQGSLPTPNVNCLIQDFEGQMWVGTNRGVAVFFNPNRAFDNIDAGLPIFDARPLLRAEVVTSIAVDGGNRKWIGTTNGLWLFSADGSQLVYNFTQNNSPLPSNHILSVAINAISGEVFIATQKGIVSFRSTATQGTDTNTAVRVFPNPVEPQFDGLVGISGLVENATVKITDISGRLVYETKANGGTATWNVQDYNGNRAKTGVYLIFSSTADGDAALVSKIAVME